MAASIKNEIGVLIRRHRVKQGLTLERLAEEADISLRFLQSIEAGEKGCSLETTFKLAHALKTTPDVFLMPVWKDWLKEQGK